MQVDIQDVSYENAMAFLEYLYTDHSPIEEGDSVGILMVSNQYSIPRLTTLCELYITKEVERATSHSIAQADIDIIGTSLTALLLSSKRISMLLYSGLLLTSQLHNSQQLSQWCLHFISSNYTAFAEKDEFSVLEGENLAYVGEHRWPPLSYLQAVDEYRMKYSSKDNNSKCKVM